MHIFFLSFILSFFRVSVVGLRCQIVFQHLQNRPQHCYEMKCLQTLIDSVCNHRYMQSAKFLSLIRHRSHFLSSDLNRFETVRKKLSANFPSKSCIVLLDCIVTVFILLKVPFAFSVNSALFLFYMITFYFRLCSQCLVMYRTSFGKVMNNTLNTIYFCKWLDMKATTQKRHLPWILKDLSMTILNENLDFPKEGFRAFYTRLYLQTNGTF